MKIIQHRYGMKITRRHLRGHNEDEGGDVKIIPVVKFAKTKGDRLWWNWIKKGGEGFKVSVLFGATMTTSPDYPNMTLYKFFLGPLCVGLGIRKEAP